MPTYTKAWLNGQEIAVGDLLFKASLRGPGILSPVLKEELYYRGELVPVPFDLKLQTELPPLPLLPDYAEIAHLLQAEDDG